MTIQHAVHMVCVTVIKSVIASAILRRASMQHLTVPSAKLITMDKIARVSVQQFLLAVPMVAALQREPACVMLPPALDTGMELLVQPVQPDTMDLSASSTIQLVLFSPIL